MARVGRSTTAASTTDGEQGSTGVSMSPPTTTSPARSAKQANSKKRKRSDDAKSLKRSKLNQQDGQVDGSVGEESDSGEPAHDKTQADVKLEDAEQAMDEDLVDTSGLPLSAADAERILMVLERCVSTPIILQTSEVYLLNSLAQRRGLKCS